MRNIYRHISLCAIIKRHNENPTFHSLLCASIRLTKWYLWDQHISSLWKIYFFIQEVTNEIFMQCHCVVSLNNFFFFFLVISFKSSTLLCLCYMHLYIVIVYVQCAMCMCTCMCVSVCVYGWHKFSTILP